MKKERKKWGGAREGSGRSTLYKENKTRVHLYLTEEANNILTKSAEESGMSRSDYLNRLILGDGPMTNNNVDYKAMIEELEWHTHEECRDTCTVLVAERIGNPCQHAWLISNLELKNASVGAEYVKNMGWKEVLNKIRESYGWKPI